MIFKWIVMSIHIGSALVLIIGTVTHVSEREGLAGIVGGSSELTIRGGKSFEDIMKRWTTYAAIAFFATAFFLSLVMKL